MRKIFEAVGFVLMVWGVAGLVHEFTGWFRIWVVVRYLDFLDGYEIFANIVLAVLGLALLVASDSGRRV